MCSGCGGLLVSRLSDYSLMEAVFSAIKGNEVEV